MAETCHPLRQQPWWSWEGEKKKKSWWFFCLPLPAALGHSRKVSPQGGWLSYSWKDCSWAIYFYGLYMVIYSDSPLLPLHQALSNTRPEDEHSPPTAIAWGELHIQHCSCLLEMFSSGTRSIDSPNPRQSVPLASSPNPLHHLLALNSFGNHMILNATHAWTTK